MREIIKSRTVATHERLGGCAARGCPEFAVCSNCVQCLEHHELTRDVNVDPQTGARAARRPFGDCGFDEPVPVKFDPPDPNRDVQMIVVEDDQFDNFVRMRRNADA